jgi:hypothetical protein
MRDKLEFNAGTRANPVRAHINLEILTEVTRGAISHYKQKKYPFNIPDLFPDAVVPRNIEPGSFEHSLYLFYACGTDMITESRQHYTGFRKAVESGLDLRYLHKMSPEEIRRVLPHLRQGYGKDERARKPLESLAKNSAILLGQYPSNKGDYGDPRRIKAGSFDETIRRLTRFEEVGKGVARLIAKNFGKFKIWDFPEHEYVPKVDRHILRILAGSGAIVIPQDSGLVRVYKVVNACLEAFEVALYETQTSGIDANDALWGMSTICKANAVAHCEIAGCPIKCKNRPRLKGRSNKGRQEGFSHLLSPHEETRDTQKSLFTPG